MNQGHGSLDIGSENLDNQGRGFRCYKTLNLSFLTVKTTSQTEPRSVSYGGQTTTLAHY